MTVTPVAVCNADVIDEFRVGAKVAYPTAMGYYISSRGFGHEAR